MPDNKRIVQINEPKGSTSKCYSFLFPSFLPKPWPKTHTEQ